jgi:hypothetical protein
MNPAWAQSAPSGPEGALPGISLGGVPTVGEEVVVTVAGPDGAGAPGATVRAVHRPGLYGEREVAIGITDGMGRVRWTPDVAGVTVLSADDHQLWSAVRPDGPPVDTLMLLAVLTLTALGAMAYGMLASRRWRPTRPGAR